MNTWTLRVQNQFWRPQTAIISRSFKGFSLLDPPRVCFMLFTIIHNSLRYHNINARLAPCLHSFPGTDPHSIGRGRVRHLNSWGIIISSINYSTIFYWYHPVNLQISSNSSSGYWNRVEIYLFVFLEHFWACLWVIHRHTSTKQHLDEQIGQKTLKGSTLKGS